MLEIQEVYMVLFFEFVVIVAALISVFELDLQFFKIFHKEEPKERIVRIWDF